MRKQGTPEQWQALVDLQRTSGLSGVQFGKREIIACPPDAGLPIYRK